MSMDKMWSTMTVRLRPGMTPLQSMTAAIQDHALAMGYPMCAIPIPKSAPWFATRVVRQLNDEMSVSPLTPQTTNGGHHG